MKVTEQQLLILLRVLEGSCRITGTPELFGFDVETRLKTYNEIINQSSDTLIEVDDKPDSGKELTE